MSQRRYVNFGTDADSSKVKAINQALAAPQVLRAEDPFMQAVAPDQLVVQPHTVIFDSGIILDENEQLVFTVPTTFSAASYTLAYQHVDEDIIGGTAATIELQSGLFETLADSVILGWVQYPGGSVALDNSMIFPARLGQLRPGMSTREQYAQVDSGIVVLGSDIGLTVNPYISLADTIPIAPYRLDFGDGYVSRLLPASQQKLSVYDQTAGQQMERISVGTPLANQYTTDSATRTLTFAAVDTGHVVDISDATYGANYLLVKNGSATEAQVVDSLYSFALAESPIRAIAAEFVPLTTGYSVSLLEALDANNEPITTIESIVAPSTADGSVARMVTRLIDGVRVGTTGEFITVRLRQTVPANGAGLLLRVRATNYDLPF